MTEQERSDLESFVNGTDVISDSDLRKFFRCRYQYFITKHIAPRKISKSVLAAAVMFFEQNRKKLYDLRPGFRSPFTENRRGGPHLKRVEDMDKEELGEYLAFGSPQSFRNNKMNVFQHILSRDSYMKSRLSWGWKGHGNTMMQLGTAMEFYYQKVLEHGAPVMGFVNKRVNINFEGQDFIVKLPEVRRGMYVDDPTIWGFNVNMPDLEGTDLHKSSLVTLRLLAYCTLVAQGAQNPDIWKSRHFAHKLGVPEDVVDRWEKDLIGPEATYRHWHCCNTKQGQVIRSTTRTPEDLDTLRRVIEVFNEAVEHESFAPNYKQCGSCPYNTLDMEGRVICQKVKKGSKPTVPKYYFNKKNYQIQRMVDDDGIVLRGFVRKKQGIFKEVNAYEFRMNRHKKGHIVAESTYESHVYGLGFEEKIIREADKVLQEEAEKRGVPIRHNIRFSEYFAFDGKTKLKLLVHTLGYRMGMKIYYPKDYVGGDDGEGPQRRLF